MRVGNLNRVAGRRSLHCGRDDGPVKVSQHEGMRVGNLNRAV
jgi:hypothetical protein